MLTSQQRDYLRRIIERAWRLDAGTQDPNKDGAEMKAGDEVTHRRHGKTGTVREVGATHVTVAYTDGTYGRCYAHNLEIQPEKPMQTFPTLSGNQAAFMACLLSQPANSVRTDKLASVIGCGSPGGASSIGLQLRAMNLVTSTNDNEQYNLWNVTAYAKAMHDEQVRRTTNAAQAPVKPKKTEWILWSPESAKPPVVRYSCEQEAMAVAESMAKRYPGQQFLCCEIHAGFKQVKVKREVVKIIEETKMEQC